MSGRGEKLSSVRKSPAAQLRLGGRSRAAVALRPVAILSKSSIFMAGDVEKLIPVNRLMAREARIAETQRPLPLPVSRTVTKQEMDLK